MDIVTHGLAGAVVAQTGLSQKIGRPALAILVAGALLPDIDGVMALWDRFAVLRYHRSLTHSFFGAIPLALLLASLIYAWGSYKKYWNLVGLAYLGLSLHIVLDLQTSFGTKIFAPFDPRRYAL
ncbi:MAG: metal-dependent hydrolase, partial [Candidatus Tectomicrobia bacterium]|nr:metal-dependent hydrolase [Candidatus Tectomicrobia bacterium]